MRAAVNSLDSLVWIGLRDAYESQFSRVLDASWIGYQPKERERERRTCSPPAGNAAKLFTSSVLFLIMSRVASVRLCLRASRQLHTSTDADGRRCGYGAMYRRQ